MTNIKCTQDQLSTCKTRQLYGLSCRDCRYDATCDPDFRRIMTWTYKPDTKQRKRGQNYGYHKI